VSRCWEGGILAWFVTDGLQIPHAIHMNVSLCRYEYVVNIPNSMTILPEMMPMALVMAQRKLTGWYHWQQKWQCSAAAVPQCGIPLKTDTCLYVTNISRNFVICNS